MSINVVREGNVLYKEGYVKVTRELADQISQSTMNKSGYTAVKLTPALFEEAGFVKQADKPAHLLKYENVYLKNLVSVIDTLVPKYKAVVRASGEDWFTVFDFHELQNAYFELTKEELDTNYLFDNK